MKLTSIMLRTAALHNPNIERFLPEVDSEKFLKEARYHEIMVVAWLFIDKAKVQQFLLDCAKLNLSKLEKYGYSHKLVKEFLDNPEKVPSETDFTCRHARSMTKQKTLHEAFSVVHAIEALRNYTIRELDGCTHHAKTASKDSEIQVQKLISELFNQVQ